ncbi:anion-transporting ATPase-like domain-containing protein [Pelagophyceae sp. CCMP2097]|nr:anion-transporting ATPase-like domain-containing protein [Pelagophyceae sp. CCMP2097]
MIVAALALCATAGALLPARQHAGRRALPARRGLPEGLSIGPSVKLIFVGGKGGVGKTSVSSAIAIKYADAGERTLIVSTDPAHSLGDAMLQALGPEPVCIQENLYAMEVDADAAMAKWKTAIETFDAEKLAARYGSLGIEAVRALGVDEFVELLATPPPGVDELVALANVLRYAEDEGFDKVVVDTAPTGHALRLLDLPQFADGLLDKLVGLKDRVSGLARLAGGAFGMGANVGAVVDDVEALTSQLEALRGTMKDAREKLRDATTTEFVIVALPTELSFLESERLADSLRSELSGGGVALRSIVLNRVVPDAGFGPEQVQRLAATQRRCIDAATAREPLASLRRTEVPVIETAELVGAAALRFFAQAAFTPDNGWDSLLAKAARKKACRIIVVGGKGGVGKTTTSASLALWLADEGVRTAVVSTDPAHSLGDALGVALRPGVVEALVDSCDAPLWALEVDADAAALEAAEILRDSLGAVAGGETGAALADLGDVLQTAPPGVDELVALLKVYELVKSGLYDAVVLDTAPTGHTLRLLALPELLDDFAERSIRARERLRKNPLLGAFLRGNDADAGGATDKLRDFQSRAFALDAMLHDEERAEFILVAAPTDMSMAESARLKASLDASEIASERLVVNGVLPMSGTAHASYAAAARKTQSASIKRIETLAARLDLDVVTLPQFDSDLNGMDALRALSAILHAQHAS